MADNNLGIIHCDTARGLTIFHGTLAEAGFSNEEATLLIRLINGTIAEAASKGKGYAKIAYPEGEKREALESAIMHQGYWLSSCEKILTIHWAGGYDEDENDFEIGDTVVMSEVGTQKWPSLTKQTFEVINAGWSTSLNCVVVCVMDNSTDKIWQFRAEDLKKNVP